MSADGTYAFDNALAVQRERLDALEGTLDPGTVRVLADWGVAPGSRCLEVGSVALWLCERVGPDRAVLATDLDVTLLRALSHPRLEVRGHDVLRDPLPTAAFDLIHCRLVLAWLPDPPAALRRLVAR